MNIPMINVKSRKYKIKSCDNFTKKKLYITDEFLVKIEKTFNERPFYLHIYL